jgi:D-alanyl-D-alanine carboxypeptidase (penicillin-binding protein 5/6)
MYRVVIQPPPHPSSSRDLAVWRFRSSPARSTTVSTVRIGSATRVAALALAAGCLGGTTAAPPLGAAPAGPPAIPARAYLVADAGTGRVLAASAPHQRLPMASTLKTLTILAAVRSLDPATVVTATAADARVECTCVGIVPGQRYTLDHLLGAMMLRSGNDAANTAAEAFGSRAAALAAMNALAADLSATDTHAVTPSGLDAPGQFSSAYDLALIARAGLADPRFTRYFETVHYPFGAVGAPTVLFENQDPLYHLGYPGQLGAKFGWTTPAGYTLVGAARRGGRTLIVSELGSDQGYAEHAAALLDWGFAQPAGAPGVGTLAPPSVALAAPPSPATIAPASPVTGARPTRSAGRPALAGVVRRPARRTPRAAAPAPAGGGLPLAVQALLSLGVVLVAGLALLSGRRPRRR